MGGPRACSFVDESSPSFEKTGFPEDDRVHARTCGGIGRGEEEGRAGDLAGEQVEDDEFTVSRAVGLNIWVSTAGGEI